MAEHAERSFGICQKVLSMPAVLTKYTPARGGGVLNPLSSPWPFAQWGLDIVGPFPKAVGNKKYLIVGTDYFTKWVEAEPLANIRDVDAKRFVWKSIVTRFGVPHVQKLLWRAGDY